MKVLSFFVIISLLMCLSILSNAHSKKIAAHVHGVAKLDIAIEKNEIAAVLHIPGADLVGFEGAPKTQEQKDNLKKSKDLLSKDYNLFTMDAAAGCTVTKRKLESDSNEKDHTEYDLEVKYKCKDIAQLKVIDLNIFRDMESVNEVTVQLITEKDQKALKLTRTNSKIQL